MKNLRLFFITLLAAGAVAVAKGQDMPAGTVQSTAAADGAESARGMELVQGAATPNVELVRTGLNKFSVGGQEFSFRDANRFIADRLTADRIMRGVRREKIAIGLGAYGVAALGAGIGISIWDSYASRGAEEWGGLVTMIIGAPLIAGGTVFGLVALGLGISGNVLIKTAVREYNAYGGFAELRTELRLGVAATPGGLGLQLTF